MGPRAGLEGAENLSPTGIRSPDRPAHSQSLYRLSYPAHTDSYSIDMIKNDVYDVRLCSLVNIYHLFGQPRCLHIKDKSWR
jgi:hypothetical protein